LVEGLLVIEVFHVFGETLGDRVLFLDGHVPTQPPLALRPVYGPILKLPDKFIAIYFAINLWHKFSVRMWF
jgi:hypothetical protein